MPTLNCAEPPKIAMASAYTVPKRIERTDPGSVSVGQRSAVVLIAATLRDQAHYEHCNTIQTLLKSPLAASDSRIQK